MRMLNALAAAIEAWANRTNEEMRAYRDRLYLKGYSEGYHDAKGWPR